MHTSHYLYKHVDSKQAGKQNNQLTIVQNRTYDCANDVISRNVQCAENRKSVTDCCYL